MIGFNITNLLPAIIITIIDYLLTRIFLLYLLLLFAKKVTKTSFSMQYMHLYFQDLKPREKFQQNASKFAIF